MHHYAWFKNPFFFKFFCPFQLLGAVHSPWFMVPSTFKVSSEGQVFLPGLSCLSAVSCCLRKDLVIVSALPGWSRLIFGLPNKQP